MFSMTNIESLTNREGINFVTSGKFVTLLDQKLKISGSSQITVSQGTDYKSICLPNILSFWTNNNFPKVT